MDGAFLAIITFALGVIPGVVVLELIEHGRPQLRERGGARAFASYLILSLVVWFAAIVLLGIDDRLAVILDVSGESGHRQVEAYLALAWRLLISSVVIGLAARSLLSVFARLAFSLEIERRQGNPRAWGMLGDALMQAISFTYAWDRLLQRLNRAAAPQIVHVRFQDGQELFGVLAAGGSADYQADGHGIVLDAELLEVDGRLEQIPNSSGVFISPAAVASIGFVEFAESEVPTTLSRYEQEADRATA